MGDLSPVVFLAEQVGVWFQEGPFEGCALGSSWRRVFISRGKITQLNSASYVAIYSVFPVCACTVHIRTRFDPA